MVYETCYKNSEFNHFTINGKCFKVFFTFHVQAEDLSKSYLVFTSSENRIPEMFAEKEKQYYHI